MQKLTEFKPVEGQATNLKYIVNLVRNTRHICNRNVYPRHGTKTQDSGIARELLRNEELWIHLNLAEPKFLSQQIPQKISIFH